MIKGILMDFIQISTASVIFFLFAKEGTEQINLSHYK